MSDGVKNAGTKGYILFYSLLAFLLFIILVVGIYYANFDQIPVVTR